MADYKSQKFVIAHRGLKSLAPENTLAAFRLAYEKGAKWLETDVDILGDGTPIICHDTLLDRTTDHSGYYYDLELKDLENIDAGSWFASEFSGEKLPTLRQLVDFVNETGMHLNLEIKSNEQGKKRTLELIDNVLAQLERLKHSDRLIVSCFNHLLLDRFKTKAPKVPVACLFEKETLGPDWLSVMEIVGADYIHPDQNGLTQERVSQFKAAGYGVNVWTVNDTARANELFNWGVNGIFTDYAHKFLPRYA